MGVLMGFQFSKAFNRWTVLTIAASSIADATVFYGIAQFKQASRNSAALAPTAPSIRPISAPGRVQPEQEVIKFTDPVTLNNDQSVLRCSGARIASRRQRREGAAVLHERRESWRKSPLQSVSLSR